MTGARLSHYDWSGGREAMVRFGPEDGAPTVVVAMPLFEEANRTRAAVVDVLRRLAERGIGGALPDLPGMGDSPVETVDATLADWREAFAAAVATLPGPVHVMAWRGGALVDAGAVVSRWNFAPVSGADVMRDLRRAQAASGDTRTHAGNRLSPALIGELEAATSPTPVRPELVEGRPASTTGADRGSSGRTSTSSARTDLKGSSLVRIVRLESDSRPADRKLPGRALWRAAEPDTDPALQAALADNIAAWIASCEG